MALRPARRPSPSNRVELEERIIADRSVQTRQVPVAVDGRPLEFRGQDGWVDDGRLSDPERSATSPCQTNRQPARGAGGTGPALPREPGRPQGVVLRTKADCLRVCTGGPVLMIWPEGLTYGGVPPRSDRASACDRRGAHRGWIVRRTPFSRPLPPG